MQQPFFSIIIATYNRAKLLPRAINSILKQTFNDFEVIIVDDGSTDNTEELISLYTDSRIRYFKKENEERSIARNYGIQRARGKFINFLDSDDYHLEEHLSHANEIIRRRNSPPILHVGFKLIDDKGKTLSECNGLKMQRILKTMVKENVLHGNAIFLRRDVIMQHQFINHKDAVISEDWHLWMKLLSRYNITFDDQITTTVVNHATRSLNSIDDQKLVRSTNLIIKDLKNDIKFLRKFYLGKSFFFANQFSFVALISIIALKRRQTIHFLIKSMKAYPFIIFQKRFIATCRHLFFSLFRQ